MGRRVFFSFHHQNDSWRTGQVRNSWMTKERTANQFLDAAAWEEVKKKGDSSVKRWIDDQLNGTSVTVLLIGAKTAQRKWVRYEIEQSIAKGNGFVGIYVHRIKDQHGQISVQGANPLDSYQVENPEMLSSLFYSKVRLSDRYKTYDWVGDDGRTHLNDWIEAAARLAGR